MADESGAGGKWFWKTSLAGRYGVAFCRAVAAAVALGCPGSGFRCVEEPALASCWERSLCAAARGGYIGLELEPPPRLDNHRTEWEGAIASSMAGPSRQRCIDAELAAARIAGPPGLGGVTTTVSSPGCCAADSSSSASSMVISPSRRRRHDRWNGGAASPRSGAGGRRSGITTSYELATRMARKSEGEEQGRDRS